LKVRRAIKSIMPAPDPWVLGLGKNALSPIITLVAGRSPEGGLSGWGTP